MRRRIPRRRPPFPTPAVLPVLWRFSRGPLRTGIRSLALALLPALAGAAPGAAQDADPVLEAGQRVRAEYGVMESVRGTLVERPDGTLVIAPEKTPETELSLSLDTVHRLWVWRCCSQSAGFWRGAAFGAGATLLGGLVLQAVPTESANMALAGAVIMLPLGALAGGVVGAAAFPAGRWLEVPLN